MEETTMDNAPVTSCRVVKLNEEGAQLGEDPVVRETALTIYVNSKEFATLVCSPIDLEYLAVGFLCSEGVLVRREDLIEIAVDGKKGIACVEIRGEGPGDRLVLKRYVASSCGRSGVSVHFQGDNAGLTPLTSSLRVDAATVSRLAGELQERSGIFRRTGGVHNAALACDGEILIFREDIGRHNTIDKIFGQCFLEEIPRDDKMIVYSGRISSEILLKVARMGVPVLISRSAPTDLAVRLADALNITVIGFARGNRLNIYAHPERIIY
ncbi:MAG TPA: formate dehydrogenase accessory sulfurtransferase FdhD [Syntrophomonadaceae bacterium]|nr:formate dehydrogenase accessory sulfurtransferase FdhD [Syntrophomonadaceae bacterium]